MAGAKRRATQGKNKTKRKGAPSSPPDPILKELDTLKRLLVLNLVGLGVKPIDIAVILSLNKSTISALVPARRLLITKRPEIESLVSDATPQVLKRLDTLISLVRKIKAAD